MTEQYKYTVCIRCITYNHEKYLADALEGFVMQKTNFPFVAIVHDDASTDGTAAILRQYAEKYPDIIKPIYETENQYSKHDGSIGRIMDAEMAKYNPTYVAMCEGDDYWTDPYKLQKQVDFMDSNPMFGLCYTDYNRIFEKSGKIIHSCFKSGAENRYECFSEFLMCKGYLAPMTWMYRRNVWDKLKNNLPKRLTDGTYAYASEFFIHSNVGYIQDTTATYRTHSNSASCPSTSLGLFQYKKGVYVTQAYYAEKSFKEIDVIAPLLKRTEIHELLPMAIELGLTDYIEECKQFAKEQSYDLSMYFDYPKVQKMYNSIEKSKAYRLGRLLLKPFKFVLKK